MVGNKLVKKMDLKGNNKKANPLLKLSNMYRH